MWLKWAPPKGLGEAARERWVSTRVSEEAPCPSAFLRYKSTLPELTLAHAKAVRSPLPSGIPPEKVGRPSMLLPGVSEGVVKVVE